MHTSKLECCGQNSQNFLKATQIQSHLLSASLSSMMRKEGAKTRVSFNSLANVLSWIHHLPLFVLFMLTNSHLSPLAPRAPLDGSIRAAVSTELFPHYTSLPMDVFAKNLRSWELKLTDSCSLDVMTRFGRPMYVTTVYTHLSFK
jgi:hypothetical protein